MSFGSVSYAKENHWHPDKSYYNYSGVLGSGTTCYSGLWGGFGRQNLTVYHPFPEDVPIEYINWLLNSDLFGHNFNTKDAEEGIQNGFSIKIKEDWRGVFGSMIALRYPFELGVGRFLWNEARSRGFTEEESLMISIHFVKDSKDVVRISYFNTNHIPIYSDVPITSYNRGSIDYGMNSISKRYTFDSSTKIREIMEAEGDVSFYGEYSGSFDLSDEKLWQEIRDVFKTEREMV
jgi:hypothetical protein